MSHSAQIAFCERVADLLPDFFSASSRVLEIGSLIVNGTIRTLWPATALYLGVDCHHGPGVDVVALAHEWRGEPESVDVVCSCECFEHDPHAGATIANMLAHLKPGGLFFSTCAGIGRAEHGTRRTGNDWGPDPDFYRNVSTDMMLEWLACGANLQDEFACIYVEYNEAAGDLYCYAIKR